MEYSDKRIFAADDKESRAQMRGVEAEREAYFLKHGRKRASEGRSHLAAWTEKLHKIRNGNPISAQ